MTEALSEQNSSRPASSRRSARPQRWPILCIIFTKLVSLYEGSDFHGLEGETEDRAMVELWTRLKSWWHKRTARAAYRRVFQPGRQRRRAF